MFNIEEEIKEFTKLIKKYPFVQDFYIGRAILYTKIGEYKKAVEDYQSGCEKYLCYDIMNICKRNNLIREIEKFYTNKINKDKNNVMIHMSRARFYVSIGEDEKALADCETILQMSPKNKLISEIKKTLIKKFKDRAKQANRIKTPPVFE